MSEDERLCTKCGCDMEKVLRPPIIESLPQPRARCLHHYVCFYCGHTEPV